MARSNSLALDTASITEVALYLDRLRNLPPLETALLTVFRKQGARGLSAMDAMRVLGVAGASFTKRVSVLRRAGLNIAHTQGKDPITGRKYGRYALVIS